MNPIKSTRYLSLLLGLLIFPNLSQAQAKADLRSTYILRADDVVKVSVYEEPDLAAEVKILKSGQAVFHLIESVEIGGLSLIDASEEIRKRYEADYIRYPKVTLTVVDYAKEHVSVIGQVKEPGNGKVPIPDDGIDVGAALATVGGISETADPLNIQLITAAGQTRVLTYAAIQGDSGRIEMKSGDKLIVNENKFARDSVAVIGVVQKPGRFLVSKTSGQMNLAAALASAGGLAPEADVLKIDVTISGKTRSYPYAAIQTGQAGQLILRGGDSVMVPKSPFFNTTITILGQVKNAGAIAFPLNGEFNLLTAIAMAGGATELADLKKVSVTRGQRRILYDVRKSGGDGLAAVKLRPNDVINIPERWY
jgi:polysaccharide export outer membrane protein